MEPVNKYQGPTSPVAGLRALFFGLFLACWTGAQAVSLLHMHGRAWWELATWIFALVFIGAVLARRLPTQNWASALLLAGVMGGAVEIGVHPAGSWVTRAGIAILWAAELMTGRESAAWALRRWRANYWYGVWLIGIAGILGGAGVSYRRGSFGSDFFIRLAAAWGILVVLVPLMISKLRLPESAQARPSGDWRAVVCWVLMNYSLS